MLPYINMYFKKNINILKKYINLKSLINLNFHQQILYLLLRSHQHLYNLYNLIINTNLMSKN